MYILDFTEFPVPDEEMSLCHVMRHNMYQVYLQMSRHWQYTFE